jgi:4-hydroxyphenylpyruvate dioxygenase
LETGSRDVASHVIKQNDTVFVFESPIQPESTKEMTDEIARRGDGVKDVAFTVTDVRTVYEKAVARGAKSIRAPHEESDKDGSVILATIATVSGTWLCSYSTSV